MKKRLAITLLILVIVVVAGFTVYLSGTLTKPGDSSAIPRYLSYNDKTSKIYLIDSFTSYSNANETYTTADGQIVEKGTPLFVITMTLRNDYTSDNPAPPLQNQDQTSPADGTAYLYLTAQLYDKDGQIERNKCVYVRLFIDCNIWNWTCSFKRTNCTSQHLHGNISNQH